MVRRRKPTAQVARYGSRVGPVTAWSSGLLAAVGILVGLGFLVGRGTAGGPGFAEAIAAAATKPGPAVVLAFAALAAAAVCIRHLRLEWLAWWPGPIEVTPFGAGPDVDDVDLPGLVPIFRQRLATLRLQAPAPVPGATSEGSFLEVLSRGTVDPRNVLGTLLTLLRAAWPSQAWRVNVVLVRRPAAPRCGATVQMLRLPSHANPPQTLWAATWEEAVRRAADHATATMLTRTRLCRSPWAAWRRFVMPGELLESYDQAVRLEEDRRYDEALDAYFRALTYDPSNMAIRLRIGQLQEKLGLNIDALATYGAIKAIAERDVRRRVRRWLRYRFLALAERDHAVLIARYRRIVLLGGRELASQWRTTASADDDWTLRDRRRWELRRRLRHGLAAVLEAQRNCQERTGSLEVDRLLAEPKPGTSNGTTADDGDTRSRRVFLELRELFALVALDELQRVTRDARWSRADLSARSAELTRACIEVRLEWVRSELAGVLPARGRPVPAPFDPEELSRRVGQVEGRSGGLTRWHEHYNAACVFALPLLVVGASDDPSEDPLRDFFAGAAVSHLRNAVAHAESAFIASRRDWLLSEDPDLNGLRPHRFFRSFEAVYFACERPTPLRPSNVHQLENARYIRDLIVETARRWEEVWHGRGRAVGAQPDVHRLLQWWRDERRAWAHVRALAVEFRHWRSREELLAAMAGWSAEYGFRPLEVPFARYQDKPLPDDDRPPADTRDEARRLAERATAAVTDADRMLGALADALEPPSGMERTVPVARQLERWQATLRQLDADGRPPRRVAVAQLCDHHAALWQRLAECFDGDMHLADRQCLRRFEAQVEATARLWRRADRHWREPSFRRLVRSVSERVGGEPDEDVVQAEAAADVAEGNGHPLAVSREHAAGNGASSRQ